MSPVGVVAVSHSPALAEAAIALALEMTSDGGPAIAAAAGTADGGTAPGIVLADLDIGAVAQARRRIPALTHDRPFTGP